MMRRFGSAGMVAALLLAGCNVAQEETATAAQAQDVEEEAGELNGLVNINTATAAELDALPGVSLRMANATVADRAANGPFLTRYDIVRVNGIGNRTYDRIKDLITVGDLCGGTVGATCAPGQRCWKAPADAANPASQGVCIGDPSCVPDTCGNLGLRCGTAANGCGGTLDCGACPAPVDLVVDSVSLTADPRRGSVSTITVRVRNAGQGAAAAFSVRVAAGQVDLADVTLSAGLAAGASQDVTVDWTPATAGLVTLGARADAEAAVEETDEANNVATVEVTVANGVACTTHGDCGSITSMCLLNRCVDVTEQTFPTTVYLLNDPLTMGLNADGSITGYLPDYRLEAADPVHRFELRNGTFSSTIDRSLDCYQGFPHAGTNHQGNTVLVYNCSINKVVGPHTFSLRNGHGGAYAFAGDGQAFAFMTSSNENRLMSRGPRGATDEPVPFTGHLHVRRDGGVDILNIQDSNGAYRSRRFADGTWQRVGSGASYGRLTRVFAIHNTPGVTHLVVGIFNGGDPSIPGEYRYLRFDDANLTADISLTRTHYGSGRLRLDGEGNVYAFFRDYRPSGNTRNHYVYRITPAGAVSSQLLTLWETTDGATGTSAPDFVVAPDGTITMASANHRRSGSGVDVRVKTFRVR